MERSGSGAQRTGQDETAWPLAHAHPLDRADADSRVPRYLQVASVLRRRIRDGHWPVGAKIATLEELEHEFGVARVTVRQAIDLLQGEGLVKSFQGRGTFVTKAPEQRPLDPARHRLGEPDRADPRQRPALSALRRRASAPHRGGRRDAGAGLRVPAQHPEAGAAARTPSPACTSPRHIHARAPKLVRLPRGAGGAVGDGGPGDLARPPDARHRRRRHGDRPQPGHRAERADGGGALRRHRRRRHRHLRRRDHLPRRLRAPQHRADRPGARARRWSTFAALPALATGKRGGGPCAPGLGAGRWSRTSRPWAAPGIRPMRRRSPWAAGARSCSPWP